MIRLSVGPNANLIAPTSSRYIKLGPTGDWVRRCLDNGFIELGHHLIPHELAMTGNWDAVRQVFVGQGHSAGKATDFTRELRDFYGLPADALWITIEDGRLWWAFASPDVEPISDAEGAARRRQVIDRWRSTDLAGEPLLLSRLSTRLTKVAGYRQTLCSVQASDYLVRRINAEPEPAVARAIAARCDLIEAAGALISGLHWRDFEVLNDLIFATGGWRRTSGVGGSDQALSDLIVEQATTGERAMVQVKSALDQPTVEKYALRLRDGEWDHVFLVTHTPASRLVDPGIPRFHLWEGPKLAEQAVDAGLLNWLIAKNQ